MSRIADAWPTLPPHIREAILTLVDAGLSITRSDAVQVVTRGQPREGEITLDNKMNKDSLTWQMARQCRNVVAACLREEEWVDADREQIVALLADTCDELSNFDSAAGRVVDRILGRQWRMGHSHSK